MKKRFLFGALLLLSAVGFAQNTIDNAFFDKVSFRGAMGTTDWTTGWSNFDPQNAVYPATDVTIGAGNIASSTIWGSPLRTTASFSETPMTNSFFTPVDYVGAFGTADWTSGWANFDPQNAVYGTPNVTVNAGTLAENTTWTKNNIYLLNGFVYVPDGITLTIDAGTVIRGDKTNKGTIIVEKGGKLIANGTVSEPIVFTSNVDAGSRTYGDWGGIIILGKARINQTSTTIEGGVGRAYGGSDDADNSGSLKYVRIEFPGIAFELNNEINGLTMGGVGSGTTIDYVQVSYSGDDSFEWFGGSVNAKHLIALRGWDDDFDTDFGYNGMVQFGVSLRDPSIADTSTSNCFESDNDGTGSTLTPFTTAIFSNISSFVAPGTLHSKYGRAIHFKKNTRLQVYNCSFAGWPTGVVVEAATTQAGALGTAPDGNVLKFRNSVITGATANLGIIATGWDLTAAESWFNTTAFSNRTFANTASLDLVNPTSLTAPNFTTVKHTYLLNGFVYVPDGVTLTIPAGTVIRGDKTNKGTIIVEKGGKLIANGTVSEPIVFTSNVDAGSRTYGDWGGIIILGKARINQTSTTIEGGVGRAYGGSDDADNSGSLKYVRIEFPGIAFELNNEINGLTMGGVGSGTTIDYVQVSYSGDDSFEWFGGSVNAKHLIALRGWDDDFDTDFGYNGMVQFGVSLRDPSIADTSTSNCFESDNDGTGSTLTPFTTAIFSNISSFIAPGTLHSKYGRAIHFKKNTRLQTYNCVFAGWPTGVVVESATTQAGALGTAPDGNVLKLRNSVISEATSTLGTIGSGWNLTAATSWYNTASFKNDTTDLSSDLKITNISSLTAPNFLPTATSKMLAKSYWQFVPVPGLANNMNLYVNAFANGSQVTTPGSMIMAYKNGECRGADEVLENGTFSLLAMSDLSSESDLDMKLYDAATRKMYDLPTVFDFESDTEVGQILTPATVTATASLTIPLLTGTNWISFNVLPENSVATKDVLNYTPTNGDVISRQGGGTATYIGTSWVGSISSIEKNKMYKLKCKGATPGSINVTNQPLTANTSVALTTGVNWIGYSPVESALVSVLLSGYVPTSGDKISTNAGGGQTATWSGTAWLSSKPTFVPGRGYALKSANGGTLTYPRRVLNNSNLNRVSPFSMTKVAAAPQTVWSEPTGKANNMNITAKLTKADGSEFMNDDIWLGVFRESDNYCYGVSSWFDAGEWGKLFLFGAQTDATTQDGYFFRVFDAKNNKFYNTVEIPDAVETGVVGDDKFVFVSDGDFGEFNNPVMLKIKDSSTGVNNIEKANFMVLNNKSAKSIMIAFEVENSSAEISICDVQGRVVKQLINDVVSGVQNIQFNYSQLTSGLYVVKANIGSKAYTQKVVL